MTPFNKARRYQAGGGVMPLMMNCYDCHQIKNCGQVSDVGWICADCRGNYPPSAHLQKQIEKEIINDDPQR